MKLDPQTTKIIAAARAQIGDRYVADYVSIKYPNGDVPKGQGACTDVVIRSLRAVGVDLQKLVHEDMASNFSIYPKRWGLNRTDKSIDHRRIPNLLVFWERKKAVLPPSNWQPGDIVLWKLPGSGLDHCGVLTETKGQSGNYTVVHNLGGCAEQDVLTQFKIVGHIRYPK
jgi:uncharacterized protein